MSKQLGANKMIQANYGERIQEFEWVSQKVATNMFREEIVKHGYASAETSAKRRRSGRLGKLQRDRSLFPVFGLRW